MTIKRLTFFTILISYALIVFGGYVASSESGMGCGPEWPLCNGAFIPILQGDTLIEFAHRIIGAVIVVMAVFLFIKIMRAKREQSIRAVAWGMIFLLTIQVLLGAVVVILDLPAMIVSAHLIIGMLFLASLIWLWRRNYEEESRYTVHTASLNDRKRKSVINHFNIVLVLLIMTLAFGGYIKHQSYGLACGWLECGDSFLPNTIPEILQTIHRVLAVASTVYVLLLVFWAFSKKWGVPMQNRLLLVAFTILLQLILGVLTVVSFVDIPWAVLHLAVGTALFAFVYEARVYLGDVTATTKITIQANVKRQT